MIHILRRPGLLPFYWCRNSHGGDFFTDILIFNLNLPKHSSFVRFFLGKFQLCLSVSFNDVYFCSLNAMHELSWQLYPLACIVAILPFWVFSVLYSLSISSFAISLCDRLVIYFLFFEVGHVYVLLFMWIFTITSYTRLKSKLYQCYHYN